MDHNARSIGEFCIKLVILLSKYIESIHCKNISSHIVEIIKVLGTPTREQISAMNPNYSEFRFPIIKANDWKKVFEGSKRKMNNHYNAATDLIS